MGEPRLLGSLLRSSPEFQRFLAHHPPEAPALLSLDGLAPCETCKGRRLVYADPLRVDGRTDRYDPDVHDPAFGRAVPCPACPAEVRSVLQQRRIDRAWRSIPPLFRSCTLASYPGPRAYADQVRTWLDQEDRWLYLWGEQPGRGKTGLASAALQDLMATQSGLFTVAPDMLDQLKASFGDQEAEDRLMGGLFEADILVLDDLGSEYHRKDGEDWAAERLFRVIGYRHDHHKRTIVTSNLDLGQLAVKVHKRTSSRIQEFADEIHITGPNLRAQPGRHPRRDA